MSEYMKPVLASTLPHVSCVITYVKSTSQLLQSWFAQIAHKSSLRSGYGLVRSISNWQKKPDLMCWLAAQSVNDST